MYSKFFRSHAWRATAAALAVTPVLHSSNYSSCKSENTETEYIVRSRDYIVRSQSFAALTNNKRSSQKETKEVDVTLDSLVLVSGSSHRQLAQEISDYIKVPLADVKASRFVDGEVNIVINEHLRGKHVFIIQSCAAPVNDSIMELLLTTSCARRAGASSITAVIPYFGYKHHRRGSSISTVNHSRFLNSGAMDFAKMLQEMGVDNVIAVDLQRPGQGHEACFFDTRVPLETIVTTSVFVDYFTNTQPLTSPIVVVAPNAECIKKAKRLQRALGKNYKDQISLAAYIASDSNKNGGTDLARLELLGGANAAQNFNGADVIIVDDIIDSGGTLAELSHRLHLDGAKNIYLCASHGLFAEKTVVNIDKSEVKKIVVTNSLPRPVGKFHSTKVHQVSIAPLLSKIILSEHFSSNNYDAPISKEEVDEDADDDNINVTQ